MQTFQDVQTSFITIVFTNMLLNNLQHQYHCIFTVQSAKRLYPSRLRTWNFASHVTFLRGFCEEVAWVLPRGISVSFAKMFSSSVENKRETAQLL